MGWTSILVRTGVFQGIKNDIEDPANYVVDDFQKAIELIFKLENLKWDKYYELIDENNDSCLN